MRTSHLRMASQCAALEGCWNAIRDRHPEIPAAVIVLGSGTSSTAPEVTMLGHFAALRWQHADTKLPEVFVSGEGLQRPVGDILVTLLHEAAHALADARGVKDTSRQGRWHNKKYAELATELGLTITQHPKFGWSDSQLTDGTADIYAADLQALTDALSVYRHPEPVHSNERTNSNNGLSCECDCGRKIRVSRKVYEAGPITCGVCNSPFRSDEPHEDPDDVGGGDE
jgi:hypothetical protein